MRNISELPEVKEGNTHVTLQSTQLFDYQLEDIESYIAKFPVSVTYLDMYASYFITKQFSDEEIESRMATLFSAIKNHVTHLNLSCNNLYLLKSCPHVLTKLHPGLESLDLSSNYLGEMTKEQLKELIASIPRSVRTLKLHHTLLEFSKQDLKEIFSGLPSPMTLLDLSRQSRIVLKLTDEEWVDILPGHIENISISDVTQPQICESMELCRWVYPKKFLDSDLLWAKYLVTQVSQMLKHADGKELFFADLASERELKEQTANKCIDILEQKNTPIDLFVAALLLNGEISCVSKINKEENIELEMETKEDYLERLTKVVDLYLAAKNKSNDQRLIDVIDTMLWEIKISEPIPAIAKKLADLTVENKLVSNIIKERDAGKFFSPAPKASPSSEVKPEDDNSPKPVIYTP